MQNNLFKKNRRVGRWVSTNVLSKNKILVKNKKVLPKIKGLIGK